MDPITAVGLAASCLNLVRLAVSSCQSIRTLLSKLKQAPHDIQRLADDAQTLQALLVEVEKSGKEAGSLQLSSELQSVWAKTEHKLRDDLESLQQLVRCFEGCINGSTLSTCGRFLTHVRHTASEDDIRKLRRAFKAHIEILIFVDGILNSRQITWVRDDLNILKSELRVLHEAIAQLYIPRGREDRQSVQDSSLMNNRMVMRSQDLQILNDTGKHRKATSLRWVLWRLPIGFFTVEFVETVSARQYERTEKRKIKLTFKLKPPPWLLSRILQLNYCIFLNGHALPYWQRTTSGCPSLLPTEVCSCLEEGDYFAAAQSLLRVPFCNLLVLEKMQMLNGQYAAFCQREDGIINPYMFLLQLDQSKTQPPSRCSSFFPILVFIKREKGKRKGEDFTGYSVVFQPSTHFIFSYIYHDTKIVDYDHCRPKIGVPLSQDDYDDFIHYIGRHWDPHSILELEKVDRWWLSALIYTDSRLRTFISSHLASFSSYNSSNSKQQTLDRLNYLETVGEILRSSSDMQVAFICFLCVFGSKRMLLPFAAGGFQWDNVASQSLFLQGAILAGNNDVFDFLVDASEGNRASRLSLPKSLLYRYLANPFLCPQDAFILKLLEYIPLGDLRCGQTPVHSCDSRAAASSQTLRSILSNKGIYHVASKSEVVVLLSLHSKSQMLMNTEIFRKAVEWGIDDMIMPFFQPKISRKALMSLILDTLVSAEQNCFAEHPRRVTIVKAKRQTYPLISTVRLVPEEDDLNCCSILINELQKLKVFPEDRFTSLVLKIKEKTQSTTSELLVRQVFRFSGGENRVSSLAEKFLLKNQTQSNSPSNEEEPNEMLRLSLPLRLPQRRPFLRQFPSRTKAVHLLVLDILDYVRDHIELAFAQLRTTSPLDVLLLLIGISVSLTAMIEYILWELFVWIYHIQRPSNAVTVAAAAIFAAYLCS